MSNEKVVIELEGGNIHNISVSPDLKDTEFVIMDGDIEGVDESYITRVNGKDYYIKSLKAEILREKNTGCMLELKKPKYNQLANGRLKLKRIMESFFIEEGIQDKIDQARSNGHDPVVSNIDEFIEITSDAYMLHNLRVDHEAKSCFNHLEELMRLSAITSIEYVSIVNSIVSCK